MAKYELQIPIFNPQADPTKKDDPTTQFAWITIFRTNSADSLLKEMADILIQSFPCRISGNLEDLTPGEVEYLEKKRIQMQDEVNIVLEQQGLRVEKKPNLSLVEDKN